ncbi:M15 family metallopeptidase [Aliiglaciecola sp. LCG003]|uniref:M15 family metallopeptidase n=1 Tax=Aliiglaciecola sp. LCG003 TaxID=3053655 RepID=UPI002573E8EC|nr:M15 family metallopeptidase [Aliiglaciecola sp. LCG003]WJG11301.1 M15 family metallopeptidase [Aliiglaciecola sp. LCG003]
MGLVDDHIEPIDEKHGLIKEVVHAFFQMQSAALLDGVDMQLVSSFRNFDRQLSIWQNKWQGKASLYDINSKLIDPVNLTVEQKVHGIMTWSALPGSSRHHWGTDFDVYDKQAVLDTGHRFELIKPEYELGGPCHRLNCWLTDNAQQFNFYRPYQYYTGGVAPEPWHLSYQPLAQKIIAELDLNILKHQLSTTDMGGKEWIIPHLAELFHRYTLNGH